MAADRPSDLRQATGDYEPYGELWSEAGARLRGADRLIIVGYSMPFTDVHTEKMLSRCFAANAKLSSVEVINPDSAAADRFANITDADRLLWYRDIADFAG
jgi:uncharacterized protein YfaP (DUF2135 family)